MAIETSDAAQSSTATRQRIIDVDVHPGFRTTETYGQLLEFMPAAWRRRLEHFKRTPLGLLGAAAGTRIPHPRGRHVVNQDARPPDGGPPASDREHMAKDLLDRYGIETVLLTTLEPAGMSVEASNAEHSAVVVAAFNDYMLATWTTDPRFRVAILVTPQDGRRAAAEVRRHAGDPRVAAIFLPAWRIRFGNEHYHELYAAAVEAGLPIVNHGGAAEGTYDGSASFAVSPPELYIERYVDLRAVCSANITSLIGNGVFEKFPELRFLFTEWGFAWVPEHVRSLDHAWREMRYDLPWVKRWPHEYVREHLAFSTQPVHDVGDQAELVDLIERHLSDNLMFATDYPHWDGDRPGSVLPRLKPETKQKVYFSTAARMLRLEQR
jgi:predicted TIM-barrel fold metal-dependent hydrolase